MAPPGSDDNMKLLTMPDLALLPCTAVENHELSPVSLKTS